MQMAAGSAGVTLHLRRFAMIVAGIAGTTIGIVVTTVITIDVATGGVLFGNSAIASNGSRIGFGICVETCGASAWKIDETIVGIVFEIVGRTAGTAFRTAAKTGVTGTAWETTVQTARTARTAKTARTDRAATGVLIGTVARATVLVNRWGV